MTVRATSGQLVPDLTTNGIVDQSHADRLGQTILIDALERGFIRVPLSCFGCNSRWLDCMRVWLMENWSRCLWRCRSGVRTHCAALVHRSPWGTVADQYDPAGRENLEILGTVAT